MTIIDLRNFLDAVAVKGGRVKEVVLDDLAFDQLVRSESYMSRDPAQVVPHCDELEIRTYFGSVLVKREEKIDRNLKN